MKNFVICLFALLGLLTQTNFIYAEDLVSYDIKFELKDIEKLSEQKRFLFQKIHNNEEVSFDEITDLLLQDQSKQKISPTFAKKLLRAILRPWGCVSRVAPI